MAHNLDLCWAYEIDPAMIAAIVMQPLPVGSGAFSSLPRAILWTPPPCYAPFRRFSGPSGSTRVQTPFTMQDLSQIKMELGKFMEDPDKYISVL
ncbi:hypothetical protein AAY473_006571 [Plecturocebus cupreus]